MDKEGKVKPWLTVITVNWFSTELIESLLLNLNDKAKFPERIEYFVIDNTHGKDLSISRLLQTGRHVKIYANDTKGETHASGLNFALSKLETEFALVVDPDVYVFKNNWDYFAIHEINTKNCSAIGTTYPRWQLGKYHNFPNPVFCLFRTKDFKMMGSDWTPLSKNPIVNFCDFVKRQILRWGILINRRRYQKYPAIRSPWTLLESLIGVCSRDTGYRIAKKAKRNHTKAVLFKAVLPDDTVAGSEAEVFKQLAGEFELYYYRNEPILTHKYSTGSRVWRTSKGADTNFWRQCIERFQNEVVNSAGVEK
jgi:hypothetical protein